MVVVVVVPLLPCQIPGRDQDSNCPTTEWKPFKQDCFSLEVSHTLTNNNPTKKTTKMQIKIHIFGISTRSGRHI